ncbi:hypothetical protein ABZY16_39925, partial [Streptomyces sp. NPDC006553]
ARFLEHQARWREDLTGELAARLGRDPAASAAPSMLRRVMPFRLVNGVVVMGPSRGDRSSTVP